MLALLLPICHCNKQAALRIQCAYRRRLAYLRVRAMRFALDMDYAATKINSVARMKLAKVTNVGESATGCWLFYWCGRCPSPSHHGACFLLPPRPP